jgi:hypothetical protein
MRAISLVPLWLATAFVVGISVVMSIVLVMAVRRSLPYPVFKVNNEFVGFTYAVFGLIYGVLLAFTIVTAWENFSKADQVVLRETTILSELWRDAQAFPAARDTVHRDLLAYVNSVISNEWDVMVAGGVAHDDTQRLFERLWTHAYTIEPTTQNQTLFLEAFLDRLNKLNSERLLRLLYSNAEIHTLLWLVILGGALPAIGYMLLFSTRHAWVHVTVTVFMTSIILLCVLVATSLQYPFTGHCSVSAGSFERLQQTFNVQLRAIESAPTAAAVGNHE